MVAGNEEPGELARGVVGSARTIAFGTSIVAPSASAATVLVLVVAYAGFASPLVVLITFAGSLCCALSIGQLAGRVPSAGWAYTYNSRGLGPAAGFLTGWMMIFAYALFMPAGVGLTRAFGSQLLPVVLIYLAVNIAASARSATSSGSGRICSSPRPPPRCSCSPCGDPVPGGLHPGEPAALHFSRLAPDRRHCRRPPAGATARHLPGPGEGPSHRSRISSWSRIRPRLRRSRGCRRRTARTGPPRPWR
jgi:hypothetical protein